MADQPSPSAAGRQLMDPNVRCPNCIDLAETLRRVVANEANHYDAWFFPPPEPLTDAWLDETEAKMREDAADRIRHPQRYEGVTANDA